MDTNFSKIQTEMLVEAQASPNLLSDLAGLEEYIAESYNNRSFIELLQNADDAGSTHFYINQINEDTIVVANNGREFSKEDVISICRSASSSKKRGETIGYRGIGFKSIVGLAKYVHLISGEYAISFSKEDTLRLIPAATRVPLIRIPHEMNKNVVNDYGDTIKEIKDKGFATIFIFTGLTKFAVDAEIEGFNPISMLFLKNVLSVNITVKGSNVIKALKKMVADGNREIIDISDEKNNSSQWCLYRHESMGVSFRWQNGEIVKLKEQEASVSAFLPTEDTTGFGILINGDFSTDPSRRHVIFDDTSVNSITEIAKFIISIISSALKEYSPDNYRIIEALVPYTEPRMYQFQKMSFARNLIETIAAYAKRIVGEIYIAPSWLNVKDYEILAGTSKYKTIDRRYYEVAGIVPYLKFLGAKDVSLSEIAPLNLSHISNVGCAEIVRQIIRESVPSYRIDTKRYLELPIFVSGGSRYSLEEIKSESRIIDEVFVDLLIGSTVSEVELRTFLKQNASIDCLNSRNSANLQVVETEGAGRFPLEASTNTGSINSAINEWLNRASKKNIPHVQNVRWRSSEIQAKEILNSIGFNLQDVSKQNIGYDLEGTDPNGRSIMIEVKSINNPGDRFELTNNEIALAQEKEDNYYIAVVRLKGDAVEIMLIADPVRNLRLERQVVQWRWVCDNYKYEPINFEL